MGNPGCIRISIIIQSMYNLDEFVSSSGINLLDLIPEILLLFLRRELLIAAVG